MTPPIYEYACTACSRVEERILSLSEIERNERQTCGICASSMEKILSVPAGYSMGRDNPASSPNQRNFSTIKAKGKK